MRDRGSPELAPPAGTTSGPAGRRDDRGARTFPCTSCGADLEFRVGAGTLECPYCGNVEPLAFAEGEEVREKDLEAALRRQRVDRSSGSHGSPGDAEVTCRSCGATVTFQGTLTSTECSFCGTPLQRDAVHRSRDRIPVDGVLPFRVERKVAHERLRRWVRSRWFAPGEFTKRGVNGRFSGLFLPFFTFDAMTFTRYSGMRGDDTTVTVGSGEKRRTVRRTRWSPASGSFHEFFDDVLTCALRETEHALVERLEPWPLEELVPFDPGLLAGLQARTYDVALEEGWSHARSRIDQAIRAMVRGRIGGDRQRVESVRTLTTAATYKHLLLPAWLLAYRFRDRTYQVVVNACTGEVQGERPWSWIKIGLAVAAVAIVAGLVAWATRA